MDEANPRRTLDDVIKESQRLRKAAEQSYDEYVKIRKKIDEMQRRLQPMPDGTVRVKPKE